MSFWSNNLKPSLWWSQTWVLSPLPFRAKSGSNDPPYCYSHTQHSFERVCEWCSKFCRLSSAVSQRKWRGTKRLLQNIRTVVHVKACSIVYVVICIIDLSSTFKVFPSRSCHKSGRDFFFKAKIKAPGQTICQIWFISSPLSLSNFGVSSKGPLNKVLGMTRCF